MSESINNRKVFTLYEVSKSIQKTLQMRYASAYWIKAEMNKLNYYAYSGHCYPDLVEKSNGKVIAQFRAVMWNTDYKRINKQFITVLKEPLKDGIKILFLANITYDTQHGISLRIMDIDPAFTLGDLESEKQETIRKLKEENIYGKNKQVPFPLLPKRIAIISVETSKGYADFLKIIENNAYGYGFFHFLFPSLLQGEKAVEAILYQLNRIKKVRAHFDVVVIIRGGGGDVGLSCFNDYKLARAIALFPLPVLTGIGHATNETVVETVAHTNAITPTKIAEYLIQQFNNFSFPLQKARELIVERARKKMEASRSAFNSEIKLFRSATGNMLRARVDNLKYLALNLSQQSRFLFKEENQALDYGKEKLKDKSIAFFKDHNQILKMAENKVTMMDPENVLKRGYSITLFDGKAVRHPDELKDGDQLITRVFKGTIVSEVKNNKHEAAG